MKPAKQFLLLLAAIGLAAAVTTVNHGNGNLHTFSATQDSYIDQDNHGDSVFLLAGLLPQSHPGTRFLVKFEDFSVTCNNIVWAKMYLYFVDGFKPSSMTATQAPYIERDLDVHQVSKPWNERDVTRKFTGIGTQEWDTPYLGLTDTDASSIVQDTVRIFTDRPAGYVEFDVTQAMNEWKSVPSSNYGLLVRATNEATVGRYLRFYSREIPESYRRPVIKVLCTV